MGGQVRGIRSPIEGTAAVVALNIESSVNRNAVFEATQWLW
jgi:hypothetical protein